MSTNTLLYSFDDLIRSMFCVAANASNILPDHLARQYLETTLALIFDKIWSGDEAEKQLIIKAYEYWTGYTYQEPEEEEVGDDAPYDDDSESIGSE